MFLDFVEGPLWYFSALVFVVGVAWRLVDVFRRGVPEDLAIRHAFQDELLHAPDIIELADLAARPVADVADVFFLVGETYRLDWLEVRADHLPAESRWERWALRTLRNDLLKLRRDIYERV